MSVDRVRIGIAGCGNVSEHYLRQLETCAEARVVAVCDVDRSRAERRAAEFAVPAAYAEVDDMLASSSFDLLVNLSTMPQHYAVNRAGLEAGRHVLCEKPIATTREDAAALLEIAERRSLTLAGAPNVLTSPAFQCMAEIVQSREIGRAVAAHGRYGHGGPDWGPWFYRKGAGSLFDLGVYNITLLTGLLGPARSVVALSGTAIPERIIEGERVQVEVDDNTMLLIDHGDAVFSSIQTGFVYRMYHEERTVELVGTGGSACLLGWDWEPHGVEVSTGRDAGWATRAADQGDYHWAGGASYMARCLAAGRKPAMTGRHAAHVLDVMLGALESAATGRRVAVSTVFDYPVGATR